VGVRGMHVWTRGDRREKRRGASGEGRRDMSKTHKSTNAALQGPERCIDEMRYSLCDSSKGTTKRTIFFCAALSCGGAQC
jgi:hypothetical protein